MYDKLNITENHLQALCLFTQGFDRDYYIREVHKLLGISPRTAQLILYDLEHKGVLESETKGKIRVYRIRINSLSRMYLVLAEQYKAIAFLEKNIMAKEIIEKITPFINGVGIIFGSYAKATAKKDSDLDIFVIGAYDEEKVRKISETYGIEVSVKCYPKKIFEKNLANDILIREVMKSHVVFLNAEQFISKVVAHGQD